jgi:PTS system ascorbate-specific IIA component
MNVGLLLITHNDLGGQLLQTAAGILGHNALPAKNIAVTGDSDPDSITAQAVRLCRELDQGEGVLVLTDLYGSTPSNIAARLLNEHKVLVISGVNIPMLLRIFNYPSLPLEELGKRAMTGARDGIRITAGKQAS